MEPSAFNLKMHAQCLLKGLRVGDTFQQLNEGDRKLSPRIFSPKNCVLVKNGRVQKKVESMKLLSEKTFVQHDWLSKI